MGQVTVLEDRTVQYSVCIPALAYGSIVFTIRAFGTLPAGFFDIIGSVLLNPRQDEFCSGRCRNHFNVYKSREKRKPK